MKKVFIVGCPRSGTTWLQMLLAQHPSVATSQETHVFSNYIYRLIRAWEHDKKAEAGIGLVPLFNEREFDDMCAGFANRVFARIAQKKPAATTVLEKTPAHVRHAPLILKLIPDAYFIHIVRDARAVVASLSAAGSSWGSRWASVDRVANAKLWCSDVGSGRHIGELTERFQELHYEALLSDAGTPTLARLFAGLNIEASEDFCEQALQACHIDQMRQKSETVKDRDAISRFPAEFYRKGSANGWRTDLSRRCIEVIEYITGDLMSELGYSLVTRRTAKGRRKPVSLRFYDALDSVEWRVRRAVGVGFKTTRRWV